MIQLQSRIAKPISEPQGEWVVCDSHTRVTKYMREKLADQRRGPVEHGTPEYRLVNTKAARS